MRAFYQAMLVAIITVSQVTVANARNIPEHFPESVDRDHGSLSSAAASEATDNRDEQILVGYVGIQQAKAKGRSIAKVIYTKAFQGPYHNNKPWNVKDTKARYFSAVDTLRPHYVRYKAGGEFLPEYLAHYEDAGHFDSAEHDDWGDYLGMVGGTCFYTATKTKAGLPNTCKEELTAMRKGETYVAVKPGKKKTHIASKKQGGKKKLVASKARGGKGAVVATIASR